MDVTHREDPRRHQRRRTWRLKNGKCGCTAVLPCVTAGPGQGERRQDFPSPPRPRPESRDTLYLGYTVRKGQTEVEVSSKTPAIRP